MWIQGVVELVSGRHRDSQVRRCHRIRRHRTAHLPGMLRHIDADNLEVLTVDVLHKLQLNLVLDPLIVLRRKSSPVVLNDDVDKTLEKNVVVLVMVRLLWRRRKPKTSEPRIEQRVVTQRLQWTLVGRRPFHRKLELRTMSTFTRHQCVVF